MPAHGYKPYPMHASHELEPVPLVDFGVGHAAQDVVPLAAAKVPRSQSMHSLEPNQNLNNAAGGAEDSNPWKGEDNSAMSKKSFTTTPSQQLHKRTLKEGKRMQEDLLRVQSILEE